MTTRPALPPSIPSESIPGRDKHRLTRSGTERGLRTGRHRSPGIRARLRNGLVCVFLLLSAAVRGLNAVVKVGDVVIAVAGYVATGAGRVDRDAGGEAGVVAKGTVVVAIAPGTALGGGKGGGGCEEGCCSDAHVD